MTLRSFLGSLRMQLLLTRRTPPNLTPIISFPFTTFVFMAVVDRFGRPDLAGYALVAPLLLAVGSMAILVAGQTIADERDGQTLELLVATPAPFFSIVFARVVVITTLSLFGIVESWLIIRFVFGVEITLYHPGIFVATMLLTALAAAGTALISASLSCVSRTGRTFQNSVMYPIFLVSGILVPVSLLPGWLEPFSRIVFLYWSANLLRDSLQAASPDDVLPRVGALILTGVATALIGGWLIQRMLGYLKREGRLSLT